ncbi:ABC transporter [Saccharobesus litoralis]|uniref:ABC transporter n=1 Tax=Saccharobesus litoralis TaxID=2172099 RepID=A0A2S0VU68_9ALTE|nr:ATP-binding cassette domain-containing protein [Saccharobesus litoralis]AWB67761.1 ABC transporter [Saccharobesus litoralis]
MIEVNNVSKHFPLKDAKLVNQVAKSDPRVKGRHFHALNNVSFHCKQGEVLGLLGANGAGKTSMLRTLSTALQPNSGQVLYDGLDAHKNKLAIRKQIGFLSGSTGLYERLTGRENLAYFAQLFGVEKQQFNGRLEQLIEQLDLAKFIDRRFVDYSTGMKQKIAIARAVIHEPKLVILDEPTTGLDIAASEVVLSFIEKLKQQGVPVIFSTHHLAEVERLCDRICVIHQGQTCFEGTIQELTQYTQQTILQQAILSIMADDNQPIASGEE